MNLERMYGKCHIFGMCDQGPPGRDGTTDDKWIAWKREKYYSGMKPFLPGAHRLRKRGHLGAKHQKESN